MKTILLLKVSFEELLISQVIQQGPVTRSFVKQGIFTGDEFLDMVKVVNYEMKKEKRGN
jgi:hypothetical protein